MLCLRRVLRRRRVIDRFAGSPTHFSAWDKLVLHKWCWPTLSFPTFFFFFFLPKRGFVVANVVLGAAACLPAWRNTLCQSEFCSVKSLALQDSHYTLTAILAFFYTPSLKYKTKLYALPMFRGWKPLHSAATIRPVLKVSVSTDWFYLSTVRTNTKVAQPRFHNKYIKSCVKHPTWI